MSLSLGRIAYKLVFEPLGRVKRSLREGGPIEQRRDRVGHEAMREAASALPALREPPGGGLRQIHFLSGPKYWHQTLFCFVSLQLRLPFCVTPLIYDDGRMDEPTREALRRVVPWMRFVDEAETAARLDALLPEARYPALHARRRVYPHLRKLTDIHIGSKEFRLVADSDMLFFGIPDELATWFARPDWFYMQDAFTAYGYPTDYLANLAGAPVPEPVNVGLYAVDGTVIDWDRVEHWCARQIADHGPRYLQEQALTAMLFAGREAIVLPRERYVVRPNHSEGNNPTAVLHHYVDISKRSYFRSGWRQVSALAQTRAQSGSVS